MNTPPRPLLPDPLRSIYLAPETRGSGSGAGAAEAMDLYAAAPRLDVMPGDRLVLLLGRYTRTLRLSELRGTREHPIEILAEPGAVIDVDRSEEICLQLSDCRFVALRDVTLLNALDTALVMRHCSYCLVTRNRIEGARLFGMVLEGCSRNVPDNDLHSWQWYTQLPVTAGNLFLGNRIDDTPRTSVQIERATENTFVANRIVNVVAHDSYLNEFRQPGPIALEQAGSSLHNEVITDYPDWVRESYAWPEKLLTRPARNCHDDEQPGQARLWEQARAHIPRHTSFSFAVDDARLQQYFDQTLYLHLRTARPDGSIAIWPEPDSLEVLDVRQRIPTRQDLVHGRDSMEAAETLMRLGAFAVAEKAVRYNVGCGISNRGWGYGQTHDSAAGRDQLDVVTYLVRACHAHWRLTGGTELAELILEPAFDCIRSLEPNFRPAYGLYEAVAGEQFALAAPHLPLYENLALWIGTRRLAELARAMGRPPTGEWCAERARVIRAGIETHLKTDRYVIASALDPQPRPFEPAAIGAALVLMMLYHDVDPDALRRSYEQLYEDEVPWGGYHLPVIRYADQRGNMHTMGKDIASLMAYEAVTGRFARLASNLEFLLNMTARPAGILPDHFEYYRTLKKDPGQWMGYVQDPDGRYAMGTANCEHVSQWLLYVLQFLIGVRGEGDVVLVAPSLPFGYREYAVHGVPMGPTSGHTLGYEFRREDGGATLRVETSAPLAPGLRIRVPVPAQSGWCVVTDQRGEEVPVRSSAGIDVTFVNWRQKSTEQAYTLRWH